MTEEKKQSVKSGDNDQDATQENIVKNVDGGSASGEIHYSGFWVRGAASIIDSIIIFFVVLIVGMPVVFVIGFISSFLGPIGMIINYILGFAWILITWGYFVFMTHKYKATLGKMAVGAEVLSEDGSSLTLDKIAIRETIGKFVSKLFFCIGFIMIAFTKKKQGLHDMIANSIVVYKDKQKGPNMPVVITTYVLFSIFMSVFVLMFATLALAFGVAMFSAVSEMEEIEFPMDDTDMNFEYHYDFDEYL